MVLCIVINGLAVPIIVNGEVVNDVPILKLFVIIVFGLLIIGALYLAIKKFKLN